MSDLIERQDAIAAVGLNTWAGSRISKLPTIEAIPIEWVNQFVIDTCSSEHDTDFPVFLSWLDKMTEKWRKENEN